MNDETSIACMDSLELDRDIRNVEAAARSGPVILTEHAEPAYVFLTHADYLRLVDHAADKPKLPDPISPPPRGGGGPRP